MVVLPFFATITFFVVVYYFRLTDFGTSKVMGQDPSNMTKAVGTPIYMVRAIESTAHNLLLSRLLFYFAYLVLLILRLLRL